MTLARRVGLKRGASLKRTTRLTSTTPLQRHTALNPVSKRRKAERPEREATRKVVLERDPICRFPGCRFPSTEVHELQRGQKRASTYLRPERCVGLCGYDPPHFTDHHRYVTEHPLEARALELAYRSWEEVPPQ